MPKTQGASPKVIAQLAAGVVTYVLAKFSIKLDPELAAALAAALGGIAGVIAGPGDVVIPPTALELQEAAPPAPGPQPVPVPVMPGGVSRVPEQTHHVDPVMSPPETPPPTM